MPELEEYRIRLLELLADQPSELGALVQAVPASQWHTPDISETGSLHMVVAHIRDLESLAFGPRVRRVLTEDNPELEPFPSHHWTAEQYHPGESMDELLAAFARARQELLALLQPLTPAGWARTGFHPPSGRRTALWWAERGLNHTREHLREIRRHPALEKKP